MEASAALPGVTMADLTSEHAVPPQLWETPPANQEAKRIL